MNKVAILFIGRINNYKSCNFGSEEDKNIWEGCRGGVINNYGYKYFEHKWSNTHKLNVSKDGWIKNWNEELTTNPPKT